MCKILLNFILFFVYVHWTITDKQQCGYKQCPQTRDGALNVHLISHSHMDAGWVKTFDEYYYGTRTGVSTANVQLIYHSVLSELLHDKRRKFAFSETSYFWRWWKEQRPTTRATFRTLVQEGRIEFAGGSWVLNDEATPDYLQIIDQYTWGLRKLNDTLGPCGKPKAAWQIDSYGHSKEQASLLAQMGFDGLFIGRVDHKERDAMIEEDRLEFTWRGSDVLGKMSDIFTHTLFNLYNAPNGFCFDLLCNDEPIVDDPDNRVFNADNRVSDFIAQIERQAKYYDHDNIMVTMGGDFTYQSAANWFTNIDKLINHVNTHTANMSDINIFYSTPSCYLKSVYLFGKKDKALYTENNDHFPYGSDSSTYWTGFYSSRPSFKYLVNRAHIFLQVVKQLTVLAHMGDSYELHLLRHAVSLVLHHDAITGTSQQRVINDFTKTIHDAIEACTNKLTQLWSYLTPTWGGSRRSKITQQFVVCHQLNISQCNFAETQKGILVIVYNPLSVKAYHHVRFPALALHYSIKDFNDESVEYQLVSNPAAVINIPGRTSNSLQELFFEAENIPPIGYTAYYISPVRDPLEENEYAKKMTNGFNEAEQEMVSYISNEYLKISLDKTTGLLASIYHVDGVKIDISHNFYYYSQGQQTLQSGAYSFRPEKQRPTPVTNQATYNSIRGNLVKEIRQRFTDWITQILRLYRGEEFLEIEWIIGPVPLGTDLGREVVTIFSTNITNKGEFFTDSNARQMMKRTCKNGTTSHQRKSVAACYYPVTSRICINSLNTSVGMCVLTDRAQGGTSYNEGEIELMIHRRLLTDDGFGLEESLNEKTHGVGLVVKGKHRIIFGKVNQEVEGLTFSEKVTQAARRWKMEPWLFFTSGDKISNRKWQNLRNKRYAALRVHGLPRHINVLTLEPWKSGSVLLRLENTLEILTRDYLKTTENPEEYMKSADITVDLHKVFHQMKIMKIKETTLAANQWLDDARQMDWSTRYVSSGSEDSAQFDEARDETDDKTAKMTDIKEPDSSEEPITLRRNRMKNNKSNYREYERRKRSVNTTVDKDIPDIPNIDNADLTYTQTYTSSNKKYKFNAKDRIAPVKKNPRSSILSNGRANNYNKNTEEGDEEDTLINRGATRKTDRKIKSTVFEENVSDDIDEGITKSIYEMYYKTKQRTNPFKPLLRNSEESELKSRGRKKHKRFRQDDDYDIDITTRKINNHRRRGKGFKADMPFFITEKQRRYKAGKRVDDYRRIEKEGSEEDDQIKEISSKSIPQAKEMKYKTDGHETLDYEEDSKEEYDKEFESQAEKRRRKRTLQKKSVNLNSDSDEEADNAERQFIVTIRPTQIRTFVIWFETIKTSFFI